MKNLENCDRLVCTAVKNDPVGFINLLHAEGCSAENGNHGALMREAACVIANLLCQLDDEVNWDVSK